MPSHEISRLILERERARLSKDFAQADFIRESLSAGGVSLFDATHQWRCEDGRSGTIPSWAEIEAGTAAVGVLPGALAGPDAGIEPHVKELVRQREEARAGKDFARSDLLREELKGLGVEVFDKEKMWRGRDGLSGVIIGYRGPGGVTDMEISTLIMQRERARQTSDWTTSDMIRDELKVVGVSISDREKSWKASDGRAGAIPQWSDARGAVPSMEPLASFAGGFAGPGRAPDLATLQQQIIAAALSASQDVASAQRTLALLQHGRAGQPMGQPMAQPMVQPMVQPVVQMPQSMGQSFGQFGQPMGQPMGQSMALATPFAARSQGKGVARQALAAPAPSVSPSVAEGLGFLAMAARSLTDDEILWLVELRELARKGSDWAGADRLRDALRERGVELNEREKLWASSDGRQGAIPAWGDLNVA